MYERSRDVQTRRFEIFGRRKLVEGVAELGKERDERAAAVKEHLEVGLLQHSGETDGRNDQAENWSENLLEQPSEADVWDFEFALFAIAALDSLEAQFFSLEKGWK